MAVGADGVDNSATACEYVGKIVRPPSFSDVTGGRGKPLIGTLLVAEMLVPNEVAGAGFLLLNNSIDHVSGWNILGLPNEVCVTSEEDRVDVIG